MKELLRLPLFACFSSLVFACNSDPNKSQESTDTTATQAPLALTPVTNSPVFPNARISIDSLTTEKKGDSVKISFVFGVKNYELKNQTADAAGKECNNSAQGQHIHFILDNAPYKALYDPHVAVTLPVNTEHYVLAFLSRSYHESLKNPGAGILIHFKLDQKGNLKKMELPKQPLLFYSRPKGDYTGKDTKKVLLDFYLYGAPQLNDSTMVKATINGTEFTIKEWVPHFIENAPLGDLKVKLELVDKNGKMIDGPYNSVERTVKLIGEGSMTK